MPKIPSQGLNENGLSPEQILRILSGARDSIKVINEEMAREFYRRQSKELLESNTKYLKLIVSNPEIIASGNDLTEFQAAITLGEQGLEELKSV